MRKTARLHIKLSGGLMIAAVIMLSAQPFVHGIQSHCHVEHQAIIDNPVSDGVSHGIHDMSCICTHRSNRLDYDIHSLTGTYVVFAEPDHLIVIESRVTTAWSLSPSPSRAPPIAHTWLITRPG